MPVSLVRKPNDTHQIGDVKTSILTEVEFQSLYGTTWALMDGRNIAGSDLAVLTGLSSLPDARGRAMICSGTYTDPVSGSISRTLRATLGAEAHILSAAEMPSHKHIFTSGANVVAVDGTKGNGWYIPNGGFFKGGGDLAQPLMANNNSDPIAFAGSGGAHSNMPPSVVLNMFVKINK